MTIDIDKLHVYGYIGVSEEEKEKGQNFDVSVKCVLRDDYSYNTDDIEYTVNYAEVSNLINDYFAGRKYNLIETACDEIAVMILERYDIITETLVRIHKPNAPIGLPFDDVYVSCSKKWERVYLSLGSNIGDKESYINNAISELNEAYHIRNVRSSRLYDTKAYGKTNQEDFVNAVCELDTCLTPFELLNVCADIEDKYGRVRKEKWGPRTLDIDIVLFGDRIINTPKLIVPHIDMQNRSFVLKPLSELAPYAYNPLLNRRAIDLYNELADSDLS